MQLYSDDPLLAIVDAIIDGAERQAFKHQLRISEIQAAVRKGSIALGEIEGDLHRQ